MSKVLIVVGHARTATYCDALGEAYASGARAGPISGRRPWRVGSSPVERPSSPGLCC